MKLLTKEIRKNLPKLYAQDGKGDEAIVHVKFFTPWSNWTWYATEGEPIFDDDGNEIDFRFFGYVCGLENELGYFHLNELESVTGFGGLKIERDLYYSSETLGDIKERGY